METGSQPRPSGWRPGLLGLDSCQSSDRPCRHFWKVHVPRRVAVLIAGSLSISQFTIYDAIEFAEPHYDHCVRLCLNMFQPEALRTFRLLKFFTTISTGLISNHIWPSGDRIWQVCRFVLWGICLFFSCRSRCCELNP